jgi:excisionase family DNA binding protein
VSIQNRAAAKDTSFHRPTETLAHLQLISKGSLAEILAISLTTVNKLMQLNKIPYVRIGRSIRFDVEKVMLALAKQ